MRKVICSIRSRNQSGTLICAPPRPGALSRAPIGRMTVPHEPLACSLSTADKTAARMRSRSTQTRSRRCRFVLRGEASRIGTDFSVFSCGSGLCSGPFQSETMPAGNFERSSPSAVAATPASSGEPRDKHRILSENRKVSGMNFFLLLFSLSKKASPVFLSVFLIKSLPSQSWKSGDVHASMRVWAS